MSPIPYGSHSQLENIMAKNPGDFRNPKVQDTGKKSSGGIGKWIGIAVAALVALLLLLWLFGALGGDDATVDDAAVDANNPDAVIVPAD
ncbi:hypothetical protein [uncultured Jannaschia sp.]|uniref:hypothetical protein n=1 Tax=uncultured Jannaschia sp. TaxID=293347 RepID=UPI0026192298|nr:hypothetical protein [uncultured Jannaschia sp.]